MQKVIQNNRGFGIAGILVVVLALVVVGGSAVYVYHRDHGKKSATTSGQSPSKTSRGQTSSDPYAGWKTYMSTAEKATFRYPSTWTVDAPDQYASNDPANHDYIALKSPDGNVVIRWTSEITGFGNLHDTTYPAATIIDKTPVAGATGDYVVSGFTTLDDTTYYPWIALENDARFGALSTGVAGDLGLFMGRNNNNPTTGASDTALFSTSGPHVNQGAPALGQSQAQAYLSSTDMKQAKLIIESFSY